MTYLTHTCSERDRFACLRAYDHFRPRVGGHLVVRRPESQLLGYLTNDDI